jgi:D-3-phosphoglycerate dehydrogenase
MYGAALDVFALEPTRDNRRSSAWRTDRHAASGASTAEAQEKVALEIAEHMSDYLPQGGDHQRALNMPAVTAEEAPRPQAFIQLAEQLGSFAGQPSTDTGRQGCHDHLCRRGGEAEHPALEPDHPSRAAQPPCSPASNMVNAPAIARSRG